MFIQLKWYEVCKKYFRWCHDVPFQSVWVPLQHIAPTLGEANSSMPGWTCHKDTVGVVGVPDYVTSHLSNSTIPHMKKVTHNMFVMNFVYGTVYQSRMSSKECNTYSNLIVHTVKRHMHLQSIKEDMFNMTTCWTPVRYCHLLGWPPQAHNHRMVAPHTSTSNEQASYHCLGRSHCRVPYLSSVHSNCLAYNTSASITM